MMTRLIPFAAVVFVIAVVFGYIMPTYKKTIVPTQEHIKSYESALAAAKRFSEKETALAQQRAQIDPTNLNRLEDFLPDGVNNVQLILDLDGLAARSGMTLSNFNIDVTSVTNGVGNADPAAVVLESENPVDSLQLSVSATGTYAEFRSFLDSIEHSLRPLDIVSVQVTNPPAGAGTGRYTYILTMRIYWLH